MTTYRIVGAVGRVSGRPRAGSFRTVDSPVLRATQFAPGPSQEVQREAETGANPSHHLSPPNLSMPTIHRLVIALCLLSSAPLAAQQLPTGFVNEVVVGGVVRPVGLAFFSATDHRMLVIEQSSGVVHAANIQGGRQAIGTITGINTNGSERGLLGVALDPAWPTRPYAYFFLTSVAGDIRIIRHELTGDVGNPASLNLNLGARYEVLTGLRDNWFPHNGGTLRFGTDNLLFVSVGDDEDDCSVQDPTSGRGAILRLDVSLLPPGAGGPPALGLITPAGNSFGGAGFGPVTYAHGLRNPFRFNIDSQTGVLYVADVGDSQWEELNEIAAPGLNFGWPLFEGPLAHTPSCSLNGTAVPPMVSVSQSEGWVSIISFGGRYRNRPGGSRNFGPQYEGNVFYADVFAGSVRRLESTPAGWAAPAPAAGQPDANHWARGMSFVTDAVIGPDGAIYYVSQGGAFIGRIAPDPAQRVLSIVAGDGEPTNAGQPLTTALSVALSNGLGAPLAGQTVNWSATGSVVLGAATSVTNASGVATVPASMTDNFLGDPMVTASVGAASVFLQPRWRGLFASVTTNQVSVEFRHSEAFSPLLFVVDVPAAGPYLTTPFGAIWTTLFQVPSSFVALDGFGFFGPLMPSMRTDASQEWNAVFPLGAPTGGVSLLVQAYANDSARAGTPAGPVISNPIVLTLP